MTSLQTDALVLFGGLSLITLIVFGGLLRGIWQRGGAVRTSHFGLPELLMVIVLAGFFVGLIVMVAFRGEATPPPKVTLDQVLPNALFFVVLTLGLGAFLHYREINVWIGAGRRRFSFFGVFGYGVGLTLAAFPAVLCGSVAMQIALQKGAQEQELVTLFKEVARSTNAGGIAQIFLAGAVIAPVCEEFLFRGFFYGVGKRYLGPVASAVVTSALFAAFHMNLAALPGLFVLALCFTIAYEATGSLLVSTTMHAIFNASQLAALFVFSNAPPA